MQANNGRRAGYAESAERADAMLKRASETLHLASAAKSVTARSHLLRQAAEFAAQAHHHLLGAR